MAEILKGAPVAEAIREKNIKAVEELKNQGIDPTLAIIRVGESPDDIAYENSILKACERVGVLVEKTLLDEDVDQKKFEESLISLNQNPKVHGILMFMPLPKHLDGEEARRILDPKKDVDGLTDASLAGVFTNKRTGFPPCTAQGVMETLKYYGVELKGKKVAVIGRSLVIGRPVAMMLMHENATVVNCHTGTVDVPAITREADVLIAAAGKLGSVDSTFVNPNQVVIDVGINWDEENKCIAGDVDRNEVEPIVKALSPVPGGIGTVTTAVLVSHVIEAANEQGRK